MLTFVAVIFVFSFVILIHECGHFFMARKMGVRVERFCLGLGKVLWSVKKGDTEYAVALIPFGGYVKMAGEEAQDEKTGKPWEYYSKSPGRRFWILVSGAGMNYLFAFLVFCFIVPTPRIGMVLEDMPAYKAGVQTGDIIRSIDGVETNYWHDILDRISANDKASPMRVEIERDGKLLDVKITPSFLESKDIFGRKSSQPKIGVGYYGDVVVMKAQPLRYLSLGIRQTMDNTLMTYKYIWLLITGKVAVRGSVTGPVGIAVIIGKAAHIGFAYLLYLIGHINLALAIFNLLPFPVLDGGHVLFLGIEKLRKRPLSPKVQETMQYIAVSLLVAFFLFVSYNDIVMWFMPGQ